MSEQLTSDQLDDIEAKAKAATPGPWRNESDAVGSGWGVEDVYTKEPGYHVCRCTGDNQGDDAEYITAMSPDVALALVAECRRLRAEVERANAKNERAVETLRAFGLLADDSEPDYGDASIGVIDE